MQRSELKEIIGRACDRAKIVGEARTRLVNTADLTDRVAVGSFVNDGEGVKCGCPATLAGYWIANGRYGGDWAPDTPYPVQGFPSAFDGSPEFYDRTDLVRCSNGDEYIQVTDDAPVIPVPKTTYKVWTRHPNSLWSEGDEWIVPFDYEGDEPKEAAQQRLNGLGQTPENVPVLLRVTNADPYEDDEYTYFLGTVKNGSWKLSEIAV